MSEDRVRFYPKMSSLLDSASSESQIELAQAIQSIPQGAHPQAHPGPGADQTRLEPSTCVEAETFALRVLDDSMEPEFRKGCIILIDPTGRARDGCYVLAKVQANTDNQDAQQAHNTPPANDESALEQYLFRQLKQHKNKRWYLQALNDAYRHDIIDVDIHDIEGVIVQRAGTRRSYHKHYD